MARQLHKLSARTVETLTEPGRYGDGGGLYLVLDPTGRRRWVFRYARDGKTTDMGLGASGKHAVSLAEARTAASSARALLDQGKDPRVEREALRAAEKASDAKEIVTFGKFADELVQQIEEGFRNAKHRAQWKSTLKEYGAPIRDKAIDAISTDDVLEVLKPIWMTKAETASRVRGRIERILDAAKAKGLRSGENPARWRGHLSNLLPKRQKLQRGHHAALPFERIAGFVAEIRDRDATAARAMEFLILTAARSGEVLGATWGEIDQEAKLWTIPAPRMKAGREHRVPLTSRALEILESMAKLRPKEASPGDYVFPGQKPKRPLSVMTLEMLLRRMKRDDITTHGFRSTFRDWAGEMTPFPREVAEAALAHVVGDATERAYRRGDALEKRRNLMDAWATYCELKASGNVVAFPVGASA
ncbi:MAG: integrase arm-type DNA-binding domain-containing protein [Siculibacillus sp.]